MNPYAPPTADVNTMAPANRRPIAFVVLGLSLLQLLALLAFMPVYWELVKTGATSFMTGLGGLVGCALLYAGAVRFAMNGSRGKRLFIASLVLLALALRGWGLQYVWSYPYAFGIAIAVAGGWFSRRGAGSAPSGS